MPEQPEQPEQDTFNIYYQYLVESNFVPGLNKNPEQAGTAIKHHSSE